MEPRRAPSSARPATRQRGLFATLLPLDYRPSQYALYLGGCVLFAVGATCFIEAGLGTDPLDVFALGVRDVSPLTVGLAQGAFAALMLAVWSGLTRGVPSVWPFVTFFFCGSMIDVWLHVGVLGRTPLADGVLMLLGVVLCALGSAYIIMSGIGIRAMDLVAIALAQRTGRPFWVYKAVSEVALLAVGWVLGGPVGVGTVCFLVFVGFLIQPVMTLNGRLVGLPNHALPRPLPAVPRLGEDAAA
jgi:uncharacterized membrane protein YczE